MLLLNTEKELRYEKEKFFNEHINFINNYLPDKIKNYIFSFLNHSTENSTFFLDENDIQNLLNINCDKHLLYSIIYVCYREIHFRWNNLFDYIKNNFPNKNVNFSTNFFFQEQEEKSICNIRQCRPNKKKYTYEAIVNIGFYNRNQNFLYTCYDNEDAEKYIQKELGNSVLQAYKNIALPQSQSDFFLIASLYREGGISSDVCSVAESNIEILIRNSDFLLVYDDMGINKKFIYAHKNNEFIEYYLYNLMGKLNEYGNDRDYDHFSNRNEFHNNFLDFFAFRYTYIKKLKLTLLHNDIFTAFVRADTLEESLSEDIPFLKESIKGSFKKNFLSSLLLSDTVVGSTENFYMPPSKNIITIGEEPLNSISLKINKSYSLSSLDVWNVENVYLTGHACLWKNDKFIDFESYLSNVAENETRGGFWKVPNSKNITNVIQEECIIAFSAGYGCYGHYLVDDLPRLGLIKKFLGQEFFNKKFIISHKTPEWAKNLLKFFLGIKDENFLIFNHEQEVWKIQKVFLSSFPHKEYNFHGYIREFYSQFSKKDVKPFRKICLSRKVWDQTKVHQRIFKNQNDFEDLAKAHGFEIVYPEIMSLEEQIQLMSETYCQVGEHGSAQHASVYNYYGGMIIGTINPLTEVQSSLGRIYDDKNIVCYANSTHYDESHNLHYEIHHEVLLAFFKQISEYEKMYI